jgi:ABC-type uncharacterized transport system ATPase subunit
MSEEATPIADLEIEYAPPELETESTPPLVIEGLSKRYQGVPALDDFTFTPAGGTVYAILGDHQAGKSTLLHLLSGFSTPDTGTIHWFGRPVTLTTPADALALGIGIVHQTSTLIPVFTVGENILLGTADDGFPQFYRTPFRRIRALAEQYGLLVNLSARIENLSRTEAFHTELLRLLYRDVNLFLLDDPFARLHPHTHEDFRATLRRIANEGKTVFFTTADPAIAHRSADVVLVLKAGQLVRTVAAHDSTAASLYHAMMGYSKIPTVEYAPATLGAVVLSTRHLSVSPALHDITLDLRRGELLAVVGLPESGQETLARSLLGQQPFSEGQLYLGSEQLFTLTPSEAHRLGIAHLPSITAMNTLMEERTVAENLALRSYKQLARGGVLSGNALNRYARELLHHFNMNTTPETQVRDLSPTLKHQLLLARATAEDYQLLVALYPTRGLALEQTLTLRRHLLAERARGKAILLLTDDPHEAQQSADRVMVIRQGRIVNTIERGTPALATLSTLIADNPHP